MVNAVHPFEVTGVDFTGALYVCSSDGEQKVYICLFTCAVSRAAHLEIVNDLILECFLQAFIRRFTSRRSLPKSHDVGQRYHFYSCWEGAAEFTVIYSIGRQSYKEGS